MNAENKAGASDCSAAPDGGGKGEPGVPPTYPATYLSAMARDWTTKMQYYVRTYQSEKREYALGMADALIEVAKLAEREGWRRTR